MIRYDAVRDVDRIPVEVSVPDLSAPIRDLYDAFLRLHLLSHRRVRPHGLSIDGLFEVLDHGVAWTSLGPCRQDRVSAARLRMHAEGLPFTVRGTFPAPPMLDYVCPPGVTIADTSRVLLGAHLAPGTMVTPAGFCGVNAGTLGACMVEGRLSAGVVVGGGSHIGGGASLMGATSGGGRHVVSVGERCLVGANAGLGISLGDDGVVEAGCYVTAGAVVALADGRQVKAAELSGVPGLIFRRNSITGQLEAIPNTGRWSGLNPLLHPGA